MGLFDDVTCHYPLPPEIPPDRKWQSKDAPAQYLDHYEIREDGTLWHQERDHRDPRWVQEQFTGELEIHDYDEQNWYSIQFWFRDGQVRDMVATTSPLTKVSTCES